MWTLVILFETHSNRTEKNTINEMRYPNFYLTSVNILYNLLLILSVIAIHNIMSKTESDGIIVDLGVEIGLKQWHRYRRIKKDRVRVIWIEMDTFEKKILRYYESYFKLVTHSTRYVSDGLCYYSLQSTFNTNFSKTLFT